MVDAGWLLRWWLVLALLGAAVAFAGEPAWAGSYLLGLGGGLLNVWQAWRQIGRASTQRAVDSVRTVRRGAMLRFATVLALVWLQRRFWLEISPLAVLFGFFLPSVFYLWRLSRVSAGARQS